MQHSIARHPITIAIIALLIASLVLFSDALWTEYSGWRIASHDPDKDAVVAIARDDFRLLRGRGRLGSLGVQGVVELHAERRCAWREVPVGDVIPWTPGERAWHTYASNYNQALLRSSRWVAHCSSRDSADGQVASFHAQAA
jgi:hypothetical protein